MQSMIVKINKPFKFQGKLLEVNRELEIKTDKKGVPLELFWRNRIKDTNVDNCISTYFSNKEKCYYFAEKKDIEKFEEFSKLYIEQLNSFIKPIKDIKSNERTQSQRAELEGLESDLKHHQAFEKEVLDSIKEQEKEVSK